MITKEITRKEIKALRDEAGQFGDLLMVAICERAINEDGSYSDFIPLSPAEKETVDAMSQQECWDECERVIREAKP